jgi:transposase
VTGLPSLRALDESVGQRIWLAAEPADIRRGFDRLAEMARQVTGEDPLSGHLFLFRSRRGDRLKILVWDGDGYVLWYKRLETGVFRLPAAGAGQRSLQLRASELAMLLDGIDLRRLRRLPRYQENPAPKTEKVLA